MLIKSDILLFLYSFVKNENAEITTFVKQKTIPYLEREFLNIEFLNDLTIINIIK